MNQRSSGWVAAILVLAAASLAAPASALPDNPFLPAPPADTEPPAWARLQSIPTPSGKTVLLAGLARDDAGLDRVECKLRRGGRFRHHGR